MRRQISMNCLMSETSRGMVGGFEGVYDLTLKREKEEEGMDYSTLSDLDGRRGLDGAGSG